MSVYILWFSGMVMFIDSEIPNFCIIYHKDDLQNKFLTGPVKMNNTIHDFINGNITYNIPKKYTILYHLRYGH